MNTKMERLHTKVRLIEALKVMERYTYHICPENHSIEMATTDFVQIYRLLEALEAKNAEFHTTTTYRKRAQHNDNNLERTP